MLTKLLPKKGEMALVEVNVPLPPAKGKESFFNLDHQVIAGSFYLSDAPEGRIAMCM